MATLSIKVPIPRRVVSVGLVAPDVIEFVFQGHVSDRVVDCALALAKGIEGARYFLVDATATESYDESIYVPGVLLLRALRERGVERGVAVTDVPIRVIGSAVSFVAATKVEFVTTREEALARLAEYRRQSAPRAHLTTRRDPGAPAPEGASGRSFRPKS